MLMRYCPSVAVATKAVALGCTCRTAAVARAAEVTKRTAKEIAGTTIGAFIFAAWVRLCDLPPAYAVIGVRPIFYYCYNVKRHILV